MVKPDTTSAQDLQAAWLWHDLALPVRAQVAALIPDAALQNRIDVCVLDLLRTHDTDAALALRQMCLGLAEHAPNVLGRAFWQLSAGVFEALGLQALNLDEALTRLVSQVRRQYGHFMADPTARGVSELLCHELLDACLQSACPPQALMLPLIQQAYAGQPPPLVQLQLPDVVPDALPEAPTAPAQAAPSWRYLDDADVPDLSNLEATHNRAPEPTVAAASLALRAVPQDLAPMVLTQALQWSQELADELQAWAPKPSRPLAPTVLVLAQVLEALFSSAQLDALVAFASALQAALRQSQRQISVLPHQADVLVQAAQTLHTHMQTLASGEEPAIAERQLAELRAWPPSLHIQEQPEPVVSAPEPASPAFVLDVPANDAPAQPPPEPEPEPEPSLAPLAKVRRPVLNDPKVPRLLYVSGIAARWRQALSPEGCVAELVLHDPDVALTRDDLQQLAALMDLLLPALRLAFKADAPVLQVRLLPAHDRLTLALAWQAQVGRMPLDDLEMSQAWQLLLDQTRAQLTPVGESAWQLSLPVQHLLCRVQLLRAGDLKLASPILAGQTPAWFFGRNPPVAVSELLEAQEVVLQAPSPLMQRVHGVVGVMPKGAGLPVLVYRADLLRPQADYVFLSTP